MSTVRIQIRRGLASEWTSVDPILAAGEMGLETDTNYIKFGNGEDVWSDLAYAGDNLAQLESNLGETFLQVADLAQPNGVASLNSSGKVPSDQLDITELAQDAVNTAIVAGTNMAKAYNDAANTITVGLQDDVILAGDLTVEGATTVEALTVNGDLTVNGTATTVNTTSFTTEDPLIYLGEGNSSNSVDLGIVGSFNNGTYQHAGLVRDASDGVWKLFSGVVSEPTTVVDFTTHTKDALAVGSFSATNASIGNVLNTEIQFLSGVSSNIQDQLDDKAPLNAPTFTGVVTLPSNTVVTGTITNSAVTTDKINNAAVTTDKIDNASVTTAKLANAAVGTNQIEDLAVDSAKIASNAVTSAKIVNDSVTELKLADGAVTASKLGNLAIYDSKVAENAAIAQSKIDGLPASLDAKAPVDAPTFTGTVVLPGTTSIGDVSATEIGYVNGVTSSIQTQLGTASTNLTNHSNATTSVHGIADTADLATKTYADTAVSTHSSDTTSVHGIADTSALATKTYADDAANTAQTDAEATAASLYATKVDAAITGNATVENITITGNLTVQGTTTTVDATNLEVTDSLIYLASEQFDTDVLDIGVFGAYGDANAGHLHAGLFRDATDAKWKLVSNAAEPTTGVVDLTSAVYDTVKLGAVEFSDGTQAKVGVPSITTFATAISSSATLASGEADKFVPLTGAVTITLPSTGYVKGQSIDFFQETGTGAQFASTNSVVGTPGLKFRTTNSVATAMKTDSGWLVFGDLSA